MSYKDEYADSIQSLFFDLESRIMADVVRRIRKTGEITSTADWQISRLHELLGFSSEEIEASIKATLNASYPEMFELYDKVVENEYTRNKDLYEQINGQFVPYEENGQLQQWIEAAKAQTQNELMNITGTIGFVDNVNGQMTFLNLTDFYKRTMDAAVLDITSGAFDYNSTLKRTVRAMTNSGVRTINYESGYTSRITVAARRAVMTGVSQMTGRISDMNAEKLGTEHFEVAWHSGARPTHAVWQGKVWSKEQLVTVCGLGTVTGLLGANCYHEYYPFFPGISERNWSDEWLEEQNQKESIKRSFKGKEYNTYEATQKQRSMETAMRAQRAKIRHLEDGKADPDEIIIQKARYQGQLQEYTEFSHFMGLKQQFERIYIDGLGNVVFGRRSRINMLSGGKTVKSSAKTLIATKSAGARLPSQVLRYDPDGDFTVKLGSYSDDLNTAISKACKYVAEKSDGKEYMVLLDSKTGKIMHEESGELAGVGGDKFRKHLAENPESNYIFVHSHVVDSSFSLDDINTLCVYPNIEGMVAARIDGITYAAILEKKETINSAVITEIKKQQEEILIAEGKDVRMNASLIEANTADALVERYAKEYYTNDKN